MSEPTLPAFTPGPWAVSPDLDADYPCWRVTHAGTNTIICCRVRSEADAQLIAAAIHLHAELVRVQKRLQDMCDAEMSGDVPHGSDLKAEADRIAKALLRA